jgi:hypothetical protein
MRPCAVGWKRSSAGKVAISPRNWTNVFKMCKAMLKRFEYIFLAEFAAESQIVTQMKAFEG